MQVRYLSVALMVASLFGASTTFAAPTTTKAQSGSPANQAAHAAAFAGQSAQQQASNEPVDVNKVSFSIGYTIGTNLLEQFKQLNQAELVKGFQQALSGAEASISKEEMQKQLLNFQRQAAQQRFEDMKKLAETNKEEGEKFLSANKSKSGVVTTKSGLQYKVLSKGTGTVPKDSDRVYVNYTGKLINGEVFSSSEELGDKPAAFTLNGVIPAWREALQLMPQGSKWEIYVPSNLAYGARGTHGKIGPNATLIFTIELLNVEKGKTSTTKSASSSTQSPNKNKS